MYESQHHEMQLEKTHPSGVQEWFCPTCGRRSLMQWQPNFSIIDLAAGDERVSHAGSTGDLRIRPPQIVEDTPLPNEWQSWLEDAGFNEWWDRASDRNNPP